MLHRPPMLDLLPAACLALILTTAIPAQDAARGDEGGTPPQPALALRGLDPVLLCEGAETAGAENRPVTYGRFLYRFASDESKARFEADPERFAIQMGGGCGRMGPLSGAGDPERFTVFDGRLFIFASDSCRDGFLAAPERHVERADPEAVGDEPQMTAGAAAIERAIQGFGKLQRVDGLRSIRVRYAGTAEHDGVKYDHGAELLVQFPDHFRQERWYGEWRRVDVVAGDRGFLREWLPGEPTATWNHTTGQSGAVRGIWLRHPLAIVQARTRGDFVAFARDEDELFDRKFDVVDVSFAGCTTRVWIDRENQRIVRTQFDGRAGAPRIGTVQVDYSAFREVDGIVLPFAFTVSVDGKPQDERRWDSIELDEELPAGTFER